MKTAGLPAIVFLLLTISSLYQTEEEQMVLEQPERFYERTKEEWDVPGMSVAIVARMTGIAFCSGFKYI